MSEEYFYIMLGGNIGKYGTLKAVQDKYRHTMMSSMELIGVVTLRMNDFVQSSEYTLKKLGNYSQSYFLLHKAYY